MLLDWQWVFCSTAAVLHVIPSNRSVDVIKDVMADAPTGVWVTPIAAPAAGVVEEKMLQGCGFTTGVRSRTSAVVCFSICPNWRSHLI
jgi:hypothetical protein